eukprot:4474614-Prymnesium_polylepis.1
MSPNRCSHVALPITQVDRPIQEVVAVVRGGAPSVKGVDAADDVTAALPPIFGNRTWIGVLSNVCGDGGRWRCRGVPLPPGSTGISRSMESSAWT